MNNSTDYLTSGLGGHMTLPEQVLRSYKIFAENGIIVELK